ncbi:unnamed protein product [Calypogeia fissa]
MVGLQKDDRGSGPGWRGNEGAGSRIIIVRETQEESSSVEDEEEEEGEEEEGDEKEEPRRGLETRGGREPFFAFFMAQECEEKRRTKTATKTTEGVGRGVDLS